MKRKYTEAEIRQFLARKEDRRGEIPEAFDRFTKAILPELRDLKEGICRNNQNVYQLVNAANLSAANAITRTYNTKLGLFWERIADLAPNVVSPEIDLGYKLPEVDVIVLNQGDGQLYYTQLKTQKNTLTGSQSGRTVQELGRYRYHWFVACIDTNCASTMPRALNRLVGKQFWEKIGIDYEWEILPNLEKSVQTVETLLSSR